MDDIYEKKVGEYVTEGIYAEWIFFRIIIKRRNDILNQRIL